MNDIVRDARSKQQFRVDDEYLNGYAKLCGIHATGVYMSLCRHSDKVQKSFPSKELIAKELNISVRSVYNALKELEAWRIIKITPQRHGPTGLFIRNTYTLLDKKSWKPKPSASGAVGTKRQQPWARGDKNRGHVVPNKVTHNKDTHNKEDNPFTKPSYSKEKAKLYESMGWAAAEKASG